MSGPPTRILSWNSLVLEADPSYQQALIRPIIYEFSNGRAFVAPSPLYEPGPPPPPVSPYRLDSFGNPVLDSFGNPILL